MKETQSSCFRGTNASLPRMTKRRRLFCLSPQKPWEDGEHRGAQWCPGERGSSTGMQRCCLSWHRRVASTLSWVGGEETGWAPCSVEYCNPASEMRGGLMESLNAGSGSLSWVHHFSITGFPFQALLFSILCICCHSERTQLRQQMPAFTLTEVQIKIRAEHSCIVLQRILLCLQCLSLNQFKFTLTERKMCSGWHTTTYPGDLHSGLELLGHDRERIQKEGAEMQRGLFICFLTEKDKWYGRGREEKHICTAYNGML